jgi:hypothetical protein
MINSRDKSTNAAAGAAVAGVILVLAIPHLIVLLAAGYAAHKYANKQRDKDFHNESE